MAKVKQPLEENGIHRAKMWEIMMYALNNTSTNTYMVVVGYISYFLIGIVGLASVLAGSIVTIMRVWDGVTDPFVGMMVDKTNGKFGKNRPFIVIGQIIMFPIIVTDVLVPKFTLTAEANAAEIASLVAQNPALAGIVEKSGGSLSAFYNPGLFTTMQLMFGGLSAVFAVCAIIALWRKDNPKYFGLGTTQKVGIKDYVDTLAHNRAIQMLVVSASTDKLFMSTKSNATVMICLFGIIFGNYAAYSSYSQITSIPICLISLLLMNKIARQMGQKASMLVGTWGGIIGSIAITLFLFFFNPKGDASKFSLPAFRLIRPDTWGTLFTGWTTTALIFVLLVIAWSGVQALSSSIVITMTADCADYEVYRTGKYVPGLMGTLFSFVDKLVSSLAATVVALFYSMVGFKDALPDTMTPYSDGIFWATIGCFVLLPIVGWLCNVVAMHFYPLTKEKMAEIQAEIGRIKAEAAAKQA